MSWKPYIKWLQENYAKYPRPVMVKLFEQEFKIKVSRGKMNNAIHRYCERKGKNTGCFATGHTPWNKDKKGIEIGGRETQFKKGHKPKNYKPVGTIRTNADRDKYIKVADPNVWQRLNRYIWEQNTGEVLKSTDVIRLKIPEVYEFENLYKVSRASNMEENHNREKAAKSIKERWATYRAWHDYGYKSLGWFK